MMRVFAAFAFFALVVCSGVFVRAITLTYITDLISASAPSASSTHTMTFKLKYDLPPSGTVVVTPQDGAFDIPATFDYTDVDFAVSTDTGATYTERDISSFADAANDGVSVTPGTSGSLVITLNSTTGIDAGDYIRILAGTNAVYGATSSEDWVNPAAPGSYRMVFQTFDPGGTLIDFGNTMDAVILPVGLSGTVPVLLPFRYNGLPSGLLAANSQNIELSLQTDMTSTCRYATSSGVLYEDMTGLFSPENASLFYVVEHGFQNNTSYSFYVRCKSHTGGVNDDDYVINFTLKDTPPSDTSVDVPGNISPGPTGNLGNGGAGDFPNGSQQLYLSSVTMAGWAIPGASVMLFQDGVKAGTVTASSDGSFKYTFANIERGSYDFGALAVDSKGRQSAMYNTPFFVGQGTQNDISGVVIAPTLALSSDAIQAADPLSATGYATANSTVQLSVEAQGSVASPRTYFATSTASGAWSIAVDTAPFAKGTYAVEAQATRADGSKSGRSKISPLQVGTGSKNPTGTCTNRSDLNCDGKVNLIDFSILLTFWNTDDAHADINQDGKVGLSDFSIMLFNWTG